MDAIKGFARRATQSAKKKFGNADDGNDDRLEDISKRIRLQEKAGVNMSDKVLKLAKLFEDIGVVMKELAEEFKPVADCGGKEMVLLCEETFGLSGEVATKAQEFQKILKENAFDPITMYLKEIPKLREAEQDVHAKKLEFDFFRNKVAELKKTPPKDHTRIPRNEGILENWRKTHWEALEKNKVIASSIFAQSTRALDLCLFTVTQTFGNFTTYSAGLAKQHFLHARLPVYPTAPVLPPLPLPPSPFVTASATATISTSANFGGPQPQPSQLYYGYDPNQPQPQPAAPGQAPQQPWAPPPSQPAATGTQQPWAQQPQPAAQQQPWVQQPSQPPQQQQPWAHASPPQHQQQPWSSPQQQPPSSQQQPPQQPPWALSPQPSQPPAPWQQQPSTPPQPSQPWAPSPSPQQHPGSPPQPAGWTQQQQPPWTQQGPPPGTAYPPPSAPVPAAQPLPWQQQPAVLSPAAGATGAPPPTSAPTTQPTNPPPS